MTCDFTQNHVFLNTLCSRFLVCHSIACSTVQQTVVTARGTLSKVKTLDKQHTQPTHSAVASSTRASDAATDYDDIILVFQFHIHYPKNVFIVRLKVSYKIYSCS